MLCLSGATIIKIDILERFGVVSRSVDDAIAKNREDNKEKTHVLTLETSLYFSNEPTPKDKIICFNAARIGKEMCLFYMVAQTVQIEIIIIIIMGYFLYFITTL